MTTRDEETITTSGVMVVSTGFDREVRQFSALANDKALREFANSAPRLRTPAAVLDWLDRIGQAYRIRLLGIWELPTEFATQIDRWHLDVNMFLHRDIPADLWPDYDRHYREQGYSAMSILARQRSEPFTFSEAEQWAKKTRKRNTWVFGFFRSHGFSDGLYCTSMRLACVFLSPKLLVLGPTDRLMLLSASNRAFGCIERIMGSHRRPKKNGHGLTEREIEVLQQYAVHANAQEVAHVLDIGVDAVELHLKNARRKYRVNYTLHAVLAALKDRLIEY
jgi:DNA-binding CsgD family transcriptional regulator